MKDNTAAVHVQVPVEVTSFLLNEKRTEITKIELKQRVTVLLVPNKHIETPNYKLERLRHDDPRLENIQASYAMIEEPEDEVGITRREKAKPKQEPVIKGVLHDQFGIGERVLADAVFRTRHRWESGALSKQKYLRRLARYRQSWRSQLERGALLCSKRYRGRCQLLLRDDEMLWRFMTDDEIALTNNEAERALRGYVLWRKGSYGVWSHRGELFRQRILSLVETGKRLGRCPQEWLRAVVRACIEKTDYPIPAELMPSTPSW